MKCQALDQAQCIQRRGLFKKELQNLLVNNCDKCYAGEIPMLKVLRQRGRTRAGQKWAGQWSRGWGSGVEGGAL